MLPVTNLASLIFLGTRRTISLFLEIYPPFITLASLFDDSYILVVGVL